MCVCLERERHTGTHTHSEGERERERAEIFIIGTEAEHPHGQPLWAGESGKLLVHLVHIQRTYGTTG